MHPRGRQLWSVVAGTFLIALVSWWPRPESAVRPTPADFDLALVQGLPGVGQKTAAAALEALQQGDLAQLPRRSPRGCT